MILIVVLAASLPLEARSFCLEYLPLSSGEISKHFRQKLVCESLLPGKPVCAANSFVRMDEFGTIVITGADSCSKPWSVTSQFPVACASVWSADLDRNGRVDLIFAAKTNTTKWEPGVQLMLILFDRVGRPVPWQTSGYFEFDSRGVLDILDLDQDGRAEIIHQQYQGNFWVTSLYKANSSSLEMRTTHANRRFPIFNRFTYKPNRQPAADAAVPKGYQHQGATTQTAFISHIFSGKSGDMPMVRLSNGKPLNGRFLSHNCFLVFDEPSGRRAVQADSPWTKSLLLEVKRRHLSVSLVACGRTPQEPSYLWITSPVSGVSGIALQGKRRDEYICDELP